MKLRDFVLGPDLTLIRPSEDELAIRRYDELVGQSTSRTYGAVHATAYESLTPAQRDILFERLLPVADAPNTAIPAPGRERPVHRRGARRSRAILRWLAPDPVLNGFAVYSLYAGYASLFAPSIWFGFAQYGPPEPGRPRDR